MQHLNIFVVHASDTLTDHLPNGAGWIDYNYLRGLAERGHTLHVVTPRAELRDPLPSNLHLHLVTGPESDAKRADPTRGGRRPGLRKRLHYMSSVRRLLQTLGKDIRFDIAQQFTPVETGLSLSILGSGIPLVLGPYSGLWSREAVGQAKPRSLGMRLKQAARDSLASLQQSQADALVITCPAAIERIVSMSARRRVHVISHGIHCKDYPERTALPAKPTIVFLAVLEFWKGIFTLIDAFERVALAVPGATLEVWGDGRESEAVRQRVAASPHAPRIVLRGRAPRERISQIMRSPSVYCMPSFGEPFGITLLEAMASGVPIVTTNAGGPPFIVKPGGGRIVPMRDVEALSAALIEILSDAALQETMGKYNRRRVEQEFDWSRSLDRMESVYQQVLGARAAVETLFDPARTT